MSENRRRSKRVAYEIFTFTAVFALPVAFFLAFPSGATGFRAAPPPPARRFSCSFVNLSQQEAQQAGALTMEELRRRYSVQVGSRLDGEYHVLRFFGDDIRLLRKQRDKLRQIPCCKCRALCQAFVQTKP